MTTYIELKGQDIQVVSSDPSNPTLGQIWYNTSSNQLKGFRASSGGVWSTGTSTNISREKNVAVGVYTSALAFGGSGTGQSPLMGGNTVKAEKWNGSSWTTDSNSMNQGRAHLRGAGTQTAAVGFGGYSSPPYVVQALTENYNGSSWTASGTLPAGMSRMGAFGTQTAAVSCGGDDNPSPGGTYNYNGSSWTASGAMNTGRTAMGSAGTQTAGLVFSGNPDPTPIRQATEKYNGTSWTNTGNFGSGRYSMGSSGTQTAALAFGGGFPLQGLTEQFNGSTWSTKAVMGSTRYNLGGCGTTTNSIAVNGSQSGSTTQVEDWNPEATVAIF